MQRAMCKHNAAEHRALYETQDSQQEDWKRGYPGKRYRSGKTELHTRIFPGRMHLKQRKPHIQRQNEKGKKSQKQIQENIRHMKIVRSSGWLEGN